MTKALVATLALATALLTGMAQAAWPERAIRIVMPFPPGGAIDAAVNAAVNADRHAAPAATRRGATPGQSQRT